MRMARQQRIIGVDLESVTMSASMLPCAALTHPNLHLYLDQSADHKVCLRVHWIVEKHEAALCLGVRKIGANAHHQSGEVAARLRETTAALHWQRAADLDTVPGTCVRRDGGRRGYTAHLSSGSRNGCGFLVLANGTGEAKNRLLQTTEGAAAVFGSAVDTSSIASTLNESDGELEPRFRIMRTIARHHTMRLRHCTGQGGMFLLILTDAISIRTHLQLR